MCKPPRVRLDLTELSQHDCDVDGFSTAFSGLHRTSAASVQQCTTLYMHLIGFGMEACESMCAKQTCSMDTVTALLAPHRPPAVFVPLRRLLMCLIIYSMSLSRLNGAAH